MNKTIVIVAIALAALAVGAAVGYALTQWDQTISWIGADVNFTVWDAVTGGSQIASSTTLELGVSPPDPYSKTYYLQNDGNVDIQVTGTAVTSDASKAWTPNNPITVPLSGGRIALTLTLSTLNPDGGTVTFTSAKAP